MINSVFDRPLVILSSPRSGSTLLFEAMVNHRELCSIRTESHGIIEKIPTLNPAYRGFTGNNLSAADLTPDIAQHIKERFSAYLRDASAQPVSATSSLRFIEKTPKNSLRVPFLKALFPGAYYIYLVREPVTAIASIMDAWLSGRFVTYPELPGWGQHWSLLLPEGWQTLRGRSLAEVAAFQWQAANTAILESLADYPNVVPVRYDDLVNQPAETIARICQQCGLDANAIQLPEQLPLSAFTLTPPSSDKWHRHTSALRTVIPALAPTVKNINTFLQAHHQPQLTLTALPDSATGVKQKVENERSVKGSVARNAPCPCGSQLRYKHCHGKL